MGFLETVNERAKFLAESDNRLLNALSKIEGGIFRQIIKIIEKLKVDDNGNFEPFQDLNIGELRKRINRVLTRSNYGKELKKYFRDFDKVEDFLKIIHEDVNNIKLSKVNISAEKREAITQLSEQLTSTANVNANFTEPIKDVITRNVLTGRGFEDTRKDLEDLIRSNPKKFGTLSRWVHQVARDAVSQYDGLVNDKIREAYGLNAFRYVGSILTDGTRDQCKRWVDKRIIRFEELPSEIAWAKTNGSGFIPDTTPENFARYRGGYNCRHSAIPVRVDETED